MRTIRTPENEAAFLDALSLSGNVTSACQQSDISRVAVYQWRKDDEAFKAAWEAALDLGTDALEDEAIRRAHDGCDKPVFYQGEKCGTIREYSDTLMIFMLKARRPDKFKERSMIGGDPDNPIAFVHVDANTLSDAELNERLNRLRRSPAVIEAAKGAAR